MSQILRYSRNCAHDFANLAKRAWDFPQNSADELYESWLTGVLYDLKKNESLTDKREGTLQDMADIEVRELAGAFFNLSTLTAIGYVARKVLFSSLSTVGLPGIALLGACLLGRVIFEKVVLHNLEPATARERIKNFLSSFTWWGTYATSPNLTIDGYHLGPIVLTYKGPDTREKIAQIKNWIHSLYYPKPEKPKPTMAELPKQGKDV